MSDILRGFVLGDDLPLIKGSQVMLRPPRLGDWAEWAKLRAESREYLTPWEPTWPSDALTKAAFRRRLRRYLRDLREDTGYAFFIFGVADQALLGGLTLSQVRRGISQSCSVGYWIGKRHAGQGRMTDALRAALPFVFDELNLRRLEAACLPGNEASKHVLRKVGFTQEGYARELLCINGVWEDHLQFALLASEYRNGRSSARARSFKETLSEVRDKAP
jgi:ribosomal-protein-alanine N-acetyltransferase